MKAKWTLKHFGSIPLDSQPALLCRCAGGGAARGRRRLHAVSGVRPRGGAGWLPAIAGSGAAAGGGDGGHGAGHRLLFVFGGGQPDVTAAIIRDSEPWWIESFTPHTPTDLLQ